MYYVVCILVGARPTCLSAWASPQAWGLRIEEVGKVCESGESPGNPYFNPRIYIYIYIHIYIHIFYVYIYVYISIYPIYLSTHLHISPVVRTNLLTTPPTSFWSEPSLLFHGKRAARILTALTADVDSSFCEPPRFSTWGLHRISVVAPFFREGALTMAHMGLVRFARIEVGLMSQYNPGPLLGTPELRSLHTKKT